MVAHCFDKLTRFHDNSALICDNEVFVYLARYEEDGAVKRRLHLYACC